MQITSKFTIAVHILAFTDYFGEQMNITSSVLSGSIHANPVIIRGIISSLKDAGILYSGRGRRSIELAKDPRDITLYDVYSAVEKKERKSIFHFHEGSEPLCPIGRNIEGALTPYLDGIQDSMEQRMREISVSAVITDIRTQIE